MAGAHAAHIVGKGVFFLAAAAWLIALSRLRRARVHREAAMRRLCKRLPKAELHAHIAGCARLATISELSAALPGRTSGARGARLRTHALAGWAANARLALRGLTLDECFARFADIHTAVASAAALRRVTAEVLADFAADGVRYLELRSTPRALCDVDASGYVCAILETLAQHEHTGMVVPRLLLSIDRSAPASRARETVELALALRAERADARRLIVGIDLSGNPSKGRFADFVPALSLARAAGLPTSVHCAEVANEAETAEVLAFRPARLGHALMLSAEHVARLRADPIPIELCPTSNLTTLRCSHMSDHPTAGQWLLDDVRFERYPVSINTDDTGVFGTCASAELARVALELKLDAARVTHLAVRALDDAFEPAPAGDTVSDDSGTTMRNLRILFAREAAAACALYEAEMDLGHLRSIRSGISALIL